MLHKKSLNRDFHDSAQAFCHSVFIFSSFGNFFPSHHHSYFTPYKIPAPLIIHGVWMNFGTSWFWFSMLAM